MNGILGHIHDLLALFAKGFNVRVVMNVPNICHLSLNVCIVTVKLGTLLLFSHSVLSDSLRPHGLHPPGFPVLHHLPELAQTHAIESVMPSNRLVLCCSLLLLPSVFPIIRVFSDELALCIR